MKSPASYLSLVLLTSLCGLLSQGAFAGSATWNSNPTSNDWNTAANWTPSTVPNGSADTATFAVSNTVAVSVSTTTQVSGIAFNVGASGFTIAPALGSTLTLSGVGITNNSATMQMWVMAADAPGHYAVFSFTQAASAGVMTTFVNKASTGLAAGGFTQFLDNATGGSGTFVNEGGAVGGGIGGGATIFSSSTTAANATITNGGGVTMESNGGELAFTGTATAANAVIYDNAATAFHAQGGFTTFSGGATGGDATIVNEGATLAGAAGGAMQFFDTSSAGNSTLIANGGSNGGGGAALIFYKDSTGGTARFEIFGNGVLDLSNKVNSELVIGSLEGNGLVTLGDSRLTVGTNNISTFFSGPIRDNNLHSGSLRKVGAGTLVLTSSNSYGGGTTVDQGILEVSDPSGSGTGSGEVRLRAGSLTGRGIVAGAVTVGARASLNPGRIPTSPQTLTIQSTLSFGRNARYSCDVNGRTATADKVAANGVTIDGAAVISLSDKSGATLPPGTVLTVIADTASTPIDGAFSNLADGSTITIGSNTFEADYEGGDGNDLTLTVVL